MRGNCLPGFHEGVADIASLSFQTPEHLKKIGLLGELPTDYGNYIIINVSLTKTVIDTPTLKDKYVHNSGIA